MRKNTRPPGLPVERFLKLIDLLGSRSTVEPSPDQGFTVHCPDPRQTTHNRDDAKPSAMAYPADYSIRCFRCEKSWDYIQLYRLYRQRVHDLKYPAKAPVKPQPAFTPKQQALMERAVAAPSI